MAKIKRTQAPNELFELIDASNSQKKKFLALNNQFARETSKLDMARFEFMIENAIAAIAISPDIAFFLAYDENSNYDGEHFQYLKTKFKNFLYLDRIIVKKSEQAMGIGTSLYEGLFEIAEDLNIEQILCEVNILPLNEASLSFHDALGFETIEDKIIEPNVKTVRYLRVSPY